MSNACLFEIISNVHLCSSWVGSGIAQRREGLWASLSAIGKGLPVFVQGTLVFWSGIISTDISLWISFSCWIERYWNLFTRIGLPTNLEIGSGAPGRPLQQGPSSKIFEDKDKEVNSVWPWVRHQAGTPPPMFQRNLQAWFQVLIRQQTMWISGQARLNFFWPRGPLPSWMS